MHYRIALIIFFILSIGIVNLFSQTELTKNGTARVLFEKDMLSTTENPIILDYDKVNSSLEFIDSKTTIRLEDINSLTVIGQDEHMPESGMTLHKINFINEDSIVLGTILFSNIVDRNNFVILLNS